MTRHRFSYEDVVTVYVGPNKNMFMIHKDLLTANSGYFGGALKKEWLEGQDGKITLESENNTAFSFFTGWLYHGSIDYEQSQSHHGQPQCTSFEQSTATSHLRWDKNLLRAYILGDFLQALDFQNAVITTMEEAVEKLELLPSTKFVRQVFEKTPEKCPLRKWTVDHYFVYSNNFNEEDDLPKQFLYELLQRYQTEYTTKSGTRPDFCKKYHSHPHGEECDGVPKLFGKSNIKRSVM